MERIQIHRALPTRTGHLIRPGEYGISLNSLGGYVSIYTVGQPNIHLTSMTFEQVAASRQAGWITDVGVEPPKPKEQPCSCFFCMITGGYSHARPKADDNPFRGDVSVHATATSLIIRRPDGSQTEGRLV